MLMAAAGASVSRFACDVALLPGFGPTDATTPLRLCWHTGNGNLTAGWRLGSLHNVFGSNYTRYIFTSNNPTYAPVGPQTDFVPPAAVPEPVSSAAFSLGLAGLMTVLRRTRRAA
ncbi:hypothetical protein F183_A33330 [Bryobacterales bacterium F-183]|nr:hypothetical protein F183_A33330 [Bryobacterales bacterium F-183]